MAFALLVIHELVKWVGIFYLAQGLVGAFNWKARLNNPIYRFFRFLTSPMTKFARLISPKAVSDEKVPLVGFFITFWLFAGLFLLRLVYVRGVPTV
jgi:hypothetical protein